MNLSVRSSRPTALARVLSLAAALLLSGAVASAEADGTQAAAPAGMVLIPAGTYTPALRSPGEAASTAVAAFYLDTLPVTNADFLRFVQEHPAWRRSRAGRLFRDAGYLSQWAGDLELGPSAPPDAPVVNVSWFAAQAYAEAAGKRLPSTAEWEYVFASGYTVADARKDPAYQRDLYTWMALPAPAVLPSLAGARANLLGVRGMVGYVWEWVDDFNAAQLSGDAPSQSSTGSDDNASRFCGAGGLVGADLTDYAAFMRIALRSSLKAADSVSSLGFRCAKDL